MSGFPEWLAGEGGGGSSLGEKVRLLYTQSTVFTAPYDTDVLVRAFGPGGSGGLAYNSGAATATGGGAGGRGAKLVSLKAGDQLVCTIGAQAGQVVRPQTSAGLINVANGNDGGNTTVVGPGINLIAYGGKGGKGQNSLAALLGGLGGNCEGGDLNLTGGRGGNIAAATGTNLSTFKRATGGGAVDILGIGAFHGGDFPAISYEARTVYAQSTGGAGIGGHGADMWSDGTTAANMALVGGPPPYALYAQPTSVLYTLTGEPLFGLFDKFGPAGAVGVSDGSGVQTPGFGAGGYSAYGTSQHYYAGHGGHFAGGGGNPSTYTGNVEGGQGGAFGGGGGGMASNPSATGYYARSGAGGTGAIILEFSL